MNDNQLIKLIRIITVAIIFIALCEVYYVGKDVIAYLRKLDLIPSMAEVARGKQ